MLNLGWIGLERFTFGLLYTGPFYFMSPFNKINIAAVNWERTKDPKYKKEWYKLIKRWSKIIRKKPKQKL